MQGIDPCTSRMQSERSSIWATSPWVIDHYIRSILHVIGRSGKLIAESKIQEMGKVKSLSLDTDRPDIHRPVSSVG